MQMIWLQAFVAVAKRMNFSDAANDIYVSQSSLSKYIQMIEKTLGVTLIDRSRRRIELTPAGAEFYRYAVDILSQYEELLHTMHNYTDQRKCRVQLAIVSATYIYGYTWMFMEYFKKNEDITFGMQEMEMREALRAFEAEEVDFAVVRTNLVPNLEDYREIRFNEEEMYVLCSRRSRFAAMEEVSLGDILNEKMALQRFAVDEVRMMFQKYYSPDAEVKPNIISTRHVMIYEYLYDNMGITIASRSLAKMIDSRGELVLVPIKEKPIMTLGLLMRKKRLSAACEDFVNYVKAKAGSVGEFDNKELLKELQV